MKAIKVLALSILFILTISLFTTSIAKAENPPNTYSVFVHENGKVLEYIYLQTDGGVVLINVRNND